MSVDPIIHAARADRGQWASVEAAQAAHADDERAALIGLLLDTAGEAGGGYAIGPLAHAAQTASRAARADAEPDLVTAALLHDAAKRYTLVRHGEAMAEMLAGRVGPIAVEVVRRHGAYMADVVHGTRDAERWDEQDWHEAARRFARWDAASFDPAYPTLPLADLLAAAGW